ncbi:cytochrome c oxidase assembly protein [Roseomonas sp. 18066]|uniref:cytochrome c oxidase assembly protein n=1 Tax=Roseomonas sp. 18066 TaxID=2681412 RepID=UPI001F1C8B47|nr:cytochrome c oxidase assembly protein [Roseomonas sp. 18066]
MRGLALPAGIGVLALAWGGPLYAALGPSFTGGMVRHMAVVAVAGPLIAIGLSGGRFDVTTRWPRLAGPIAASVFEFLAVWGWHLPGPHNAASTSLGFRGLEQGTFLAAGLLLWMASIGPGARGAGGIVALLLTSMHMTLLGALLTLAPRPLYDHEACLGLTVLEDQSLGGVVMLLVGGAAYLAGGLVLAARLLREERPA